MAMIKFFRVPFAESGDLAAVPDDVQAGGDVSYSQGYGPDYGDDPAGGPPAKRIERDQYNQILLSATTAIQELQAQSIPDFITTALNGGAPYPYKAGARVYFDPGGGRLVYEATADNSNIPTGAGWIPDATINALLTQIVLKAPLASPTFTGDIASDGSITSTSGSAQSLSVIRTGGNQATATLFTGSNNGSLILSALGNVAQRISAVTSTMVFFQNDVEVAQFDNSGKLKLKQDLTLDDNKPIELGAGVDGSLSSDGADVILNLSNTADLFLKDNGVTRYQYDNDALMHIFGQAVNFTGVVRRDGVTTFAVVASGSSTGSTLQSNVVGVSSISDGGIFASVYRLMDINLSSNAFSTTSLSGTANGQILLAAGIVTTVGQIDINTIQVAIVNVNGTLPDFADVTMDFTIIDGGR